MQHCSTVRKIYFCWHSPIKWRSSQDHVSHVWCVCARCGLSHRLMFPFITTKAWPLKWCMSRGFSSWAVPRYNFPRRPRPPPFPRPIYGSKKRCGHPQPRNPVLPRPVKCRHKDANLRTLLNLSMNSIPLVSIPITIATDESPTAREKCAWHAPKIPKEKWTVNATINLGIHFKSNVDAVLPLQQTRNTLI